MEFETEWRVRRTDGQYRWLSIRGVPIRDAAGRLWKWVGTCTDIEQSKRLEAKLRRSEQETAETLTLLEALQATAPVGFAFVDREFRIVRINETLASVNGGAVEDQIGRTVAEVVPGSGPNWKLNTGACSKRANPSSAPKSSGRAPQREEDFDTG